MVNRQDENLGKIHELAIDAEDGRLVCVELSIGGFMGMGNNLFAMLWKAFEFHATGHKLILNSMFVLEAVQTLIACAISDNFAIQVKARELGTCN